MKEESVRGGRESVVVFGPIRIAALCELVRSLVSLPRLSSRKINVFFVRLEIKHLSAFVEEHATAWPLSVERS